MSLKYQKVLAIAIFLTLARANAERSYTVNLVNAGENLFTFGMSKTDSPNDTTFDWWIKKSIDHGRTWRVVDSLKSNTVRQIPWVATTDSLGQIFVAGVAEFNGREMWTVRKSLDGGDSWKTVDVFSPTEDNWAFATAITTDSSDSIYVGGYARFDSPEGALKGIPWIIRKSTDHGKSWVTVDFYKIPDCEYPACTSQSHPTSLEVNSKGTIFGIGEFESFYATHKYSTFDFLRSSRDSGQTWNSIPALDEIPIDLKVGEDQSLYMISQTHMVPNQHRQWLVYRSEDEGASWETLDLFVDDVMDYFPHSLVLTSKTQLCVAGEARKDGYFHNILIRCSWDSGAHWASTFNFSPPKGWVTNVKMSKSLDDIIYVVMNEECYISGVGFVTPRFYSSSDFGKSWKEITGNL